MASVGTTYTSLTGANSNKITVHDGRVGVNRVHRQACAIQTVETDLISTDARRADQTKHLARMAIPQIPQIRFCVHSSVSVSLPPLRSFFCSVTKAIAGTGFLIVAPIRHARNCVDLKEA